MRVTSSMLYNNINMNLQKQMSELYKLNEDLASGVRIHKPSDDPYLAGLALKYDSGIGENKQWMENMENGKKWLAYSTDSLSHVQDISQTLYSKAVQGDNDALSDESKAAIAREVDALLEELYKMSNQTYLGKSIFNGDATNVPPFLDRRDSIDNSIIGAAQFTEFEGGNPDNPIYRYSSSIAEGGISASNASVTAGNTFTVQIGGNSETITIPEGTTPPANTEELVTVLNKALQANENTNKKINVIENSTGDGVIFQSEYGSITLASGSVDLSAAGLNIQNLTSQDAGIYLNKNGETLQTVIGDSDINKVSINGEINRRTSENQYTDISLNGGSIFQPNGSNGSNDIFKMVIQLRDGLLANDTDMIGPQVENIQRAMDKITAEQTSAGTTYNRLDVAHESMQTNNINLTDALSKIEDTDVASAMMEYTRLEATYSMSLQVGAKIMQTSLVKYI